jgi:hypothetical protein
MSACRTRRVHNTSNVALRGQVIHRRVTMAHEACQFRERINTPS